MPIKYGDRVKVEYKGTLDDGTVFETSELRGRPIQILVGARQVVKGFENALIGMEKGEEKEFKVQPSEAYGEYNPQQVEEVLRSQFPKDIEPKLGLEVTVGQPNGVKARGRIVEITDEAAIVDLNHPLAGKVLNFQVKVVDVFGQQS
jgi:FKBP-type peptidyl-prolyl cis-trans isomerase 2